jgi:hypothetical protein
MWHTDRLQGLTLLEICALGIVFVIPLQAGGLEFAWIGIGAGTVLSLEAACARVCGY